MPKNRHGGPTLEPGDPRAGNDVALHLSRQSSGHAGIWRALRLHLVAKMGQVGSKLDGAMLANLKPKVINLAQF